MKVAHYLLVMVAIVALAAIVVMVASNRDAARALVTEIDDLPEVDSCETWDDVVSQRTREPEVMAPIGAIRIGRQFRVNCASMDGGAATDMLVPMDGGTASIRVDADTIYVAPISTSAVEIRVGLGGDVTSSTGFEVGTSGRDGTGLAIDLTNSAKPYCMSTATAVQADVIVGRQ